MVRTAAKDVADARTVSGDLTGLTGKLREIGGRLESGAAAVSDQELRGAALAVAGDLERLGDGPAALRGLTGLSRLREAVDRKCPA
ncbi:hypothetical protein [Amycolatopsis sp. CA-230715]|uniref:hypothetical protein n=1 Tax=Amycolatopsis sp. CA-230715 TaxID=2745196 RepID=UPI001C0333E4|nr:hypothetical protein [Amycolatopsis sp. CA-230715]